MSAVKPMPWRFGAGVSNVNTHGDGAWGVEHVGGLNGAVLGEGVGRKSRVAVLLGTGRKLRPVQYVSLGAREAEHEIHWEPFGVALDLLVQALGGDVIERGRAPDRG
jgi:hypothetical protein